MKSSLFDHYFGERGRTDSLEGVAVSPADPQAVEARFQMLDELVPGTFRKVMIGHPLLNATKIEMDGFPEGSTRYQDIFNWLVGINPPDQIRLDINL